jgi:outer membrane protein TolC
MPPPASRPAALSRAAAGVGLLLVVLAAGRGAGQPPAPAPAPAPAREANGKEADDEPADDRPVLSLGDCIAIAVERQPALRAVRASQEATGAGFNALNNIGRLGQLLAPDLAYRKEQSTRGVVAAAADVQKLHNEIVHDATRLYYTAVYARQQARFTDDVVAQVDSLVKLAKAQLDAPDPGKMDQGKLNAMQIGLARARGLNAKARVGEERAFAALREVMGVGEAGFRFRLQDRELPVMRQNVPLTKDLVVDLALCRRPELVLAAAGADAFRLEVYAQGAIDHRRTVPTLAAGADIHARMAPAGSRDPGTDYRPEPVLPEMPPQLVGRRDDRVARAAALSRRADAFYDKVRELVVLDAENAFFNFRLAAEQVGIGKDQNATAVDLMGYIQRNFSDPRAPKEQLATLYAQAAEAQADYVTAVYQYLLTLAALERVTAGGIRPEFPGR